jgi:UDP-GlcNAc:undecaprenyl-phosphate GlcNAc-1-phosphate transferase
MNHDAINYIFIILSSCTLVAGIIYSLYPWSDRIHLVDIPNHRKIHHIPTPKIGGLAIALVLLIEMVMWRSSFEVDFRILLSFLIFFIFSLLDDLFDLSSLKQFFLHVIAASVAVVYGNLQVHDLGHLFGGPALVLSPLVSQLFSIIALVGLINAFNMFDGMNGLLGSITILLASLFLTLSIFYQQNQVTILAAILLGSFLGFMIFNMPHTKKNKNRKIVFMGDMGSSLAGFMVYWITIEMTQTQSMPSISPISMVWFLALPLMDMLRVMLKRLNSKVALGRSDNIHFHHILFAKKWNELAIVKCALTICLFFICIGCLSFFVVPDVILFAFFWIVFFLYSYQLNHKL